MLRRDPPWDRIQPFRGRGAGGHVWFHQHFNLGGAPARYLAFHSPRGASGNTERVLDPARDQIEHPQEDPVVRETFARELGKRGVQPLMPAQAYTDPNYEWDYGGDD